MKKQILFIHSAEKQETGAGSNHIVNYLREHSGEEYDIFYPKMPDPENPTYDAWKRIISKEFTWLEGDVILIGHSLGGSVLLKYLSEEKIENNISGLFLIAAPHWGKDKDWMIDEYFLQKDFASKLPPIKKIFMYHSRDDEWVPFSHLFYYKDELPQAAVRKFGVKGHNFTTGIPELIADLKSL